MTKISKYLLIIASLLLTAACEKVLDIDPDAHRYVVANALPLADSTMFVNITYSRFFLDNRRFDPVEDAEVTIDINGVAVNYSYRDSANYWFSAVCHEGDSLTLHLDVHGDVTTATTRVPYRADVTLPTIDIDSTTAYTTHNITFTLSDRPGKRDLYYVYIVRSDSGIAWNRLERRWDTIDTIVNPMFYFYDPRITTPNVNFTDDLMHYYHHLLFTDSLIDGSDVEMTLAMISARDTAEHPLKRTFKLVVKTMSPEAFLYTKDIHSNSSTDQYFSEPRAVYTNLRGPALGIFAAMTRREYELDIQLR